MPRLIDAEPSRYSDTQQMTLSGLEDDKYRVIKTNDLRMEADGVLSRDYYAQVISWVEEFQIDTFVFVLRPDRDYHARVALSAYAESVRAFDAELADDLHGVLSLLSVPSPAAPD